MNALPLIAVFGIGGWEVVLILAILLILISAKSWPDLWKGLGKGMKEFRRASEDITEEIRHVVGAEPRAPGNTNHWDELKLFIAQGFSVGRSPFAPGTFGTLIGFAWFALLVAMGNFWAYLAALIESIALSIWLCDDAEKILRKTDPGSVVLDEIIAIPFCYLPWVFMQWMWRDYAMPPLATFFTGKGLIASALIFVGFRVFDIWKPWPIRGLQNLPGGWGVTVDDIVAAMYVALLTIPFLRVLSS